MTKSSIEIKPEGDRIIVRLTNLGVATKKHRRSWTIFCPTLKVLGFSVKSEKDAFEDFEKNLKIFFGVHLKDSTLHDALISFDWVKRELQIPKFNVNNAPSLNLKDFELAIAA